MRLHWKVRIVLHIHERFFFSNIISNVLSFVSHFDLMDDIVSMKMKNDND